MLHKLRGERRVSKAARGRRSVTRFLFRFSLSLVPNFPSARSFVTASGTGVNSNGASSERSDCLFRVFIAKLFLHTQFF